MNREQLDQRHSATIRRHWRTLTDNGGQPPQQLLDDLAAIANDCVAEFHRGTELVRSGLPPSEMIPVPAERAAAPARTAPRRPTARKTAK